MLTNRIEKLNWESLEDCRIESHIFYLDNVRTDSYEPQYIKLCHLIICI